MKPKAKVEDCRRLWDLLRDGQWHKGKDLAMESRMIRACCSEKPEHFLSGQQGYRLVKHSSDEDIAMAAADLRSRMHHLKLRADALESVLEDRYQGRLAV